MQRKKLKQRNKLRKETTGYLDAVDLLKIKKEKKELEQKVSGESTPKTPKGKDIIFKDAAIKSFIKA